MRIRYNRGSLADTIRAARQLAARAEKPAYVFPTAYGLTIDWQKPPFGLQHYTVSPDGAYQFTDATYQYREATK